MSPQTKAELAAYGKIALGVCRIGGAVALATGHGLAATLLRSGGMGTAQMCYLASKSFEEGVKGIKEGWSEITP